MLDRLPSSLQHMLLLEWLSPESVCALARTTGVLRRAVLCAPLPFSAGETVVADACVRWFQEHGVPLRLWVRVETIEGLVEEHYCNGKLHRDCDLPAVVNFTGTQEWYQHGKLHRDGDKPAIIWGNGTRQWYQNDVPHRDGDKPAVIHANGMLTWYKHGEKIRQCHVFSNVVFA